MRQPLVVGGADVIVKAYAAEMRLAAGAFLRIRETVNRR